jgi:hypothetical protein
MTDALDRAVDARIDSHTPALLPPFSVLQARKRRRDRRRRTAAGGAVAICMVAGAALARALPADQSPALTTAAPSGSPTSVASATPAAGRGIRQIPTTADIRASALEHGPQPGSTVDLLASVSDDGTIGRMIGWVDGRSFCETHTVDHPSYGQVPVEPALCGPLDQNFDNLSFSRVLGLVADGQLKQFIWGFAPAGSTAVRLAGPGLTPVAAPVNDGGRRWNGARFFLATWPARTKVTVTALSADSKVIATLHG